MLDVEVAAFVPADRAYTRYYDRCIEDDLETPGAWLEYSRLVEAFEHDFLQLEVVPVVWRDSCGSCPVLNLRHSECVLVLVQR